MNNKKQHIASIQPQSTHTLRRLPMALAIASLFVMPAHAADTFIDVGPYSGTPFISSDGTTVATTNTSGHASVWTSAGVQDLGTLGGTYSSAYAISADGSTVVGNADTTNNAARHAFRWTSGGMVDMGTLGGNSYAYVVSADGSTVAGYAYTTNNAARHAFRWTSGGMADLGTLGGTYSYAYAISADGSTVVGYANTASNATHAFRWTSGSMADLGTLGGTYSNAYAISADGSTVVGYADTTSNATHAFRWTSGGMVDMGTLGGTNSYANAISADGSTVAGYANTTNNAARHAFRWTTSGGMVDMGTLGGTNSYAYAVSADGSTVVGGADTTGGAQQAFRWTSATGMQSITSWLAAANVTVPTGWNLQNATGVSKDGSVVVGTGTNPSSALEVWLARVSAIGSGIVNLAAFNQSVINTGSSVTMVGANMPDLTMEGAHHRTLLDSGLGRTNGNGMGAWATADAAHFNANKSDLQLAEAGVFKDIGAARIGLGVGQAWNRQGMDLGGGATYNGQYLIAETDYMFTPHIEGSITGYYGSFATNVNRNYQNGATIATSSGNTRTTSGSLRVRLDWLDMAKVGRFTLSPYAAYTWSQANVGAYTESGGGFPVSYNASTTNNNAVRVGTGAKTPINGSTDLVINTEAVHSMESSTSGTSGQIIGLGGFAVPGQNIRQNWIRMMVDIDHRLTDKSLISVGVNAGTTGGDPSYGGTVSYHASF